MYVNVKYRKEELNGYGGKEYLFYTELPLEPYQKVLVPSNDGELKKAIVTEINVPDTEIDPSWANRIKEIKELDKG